MHDKHRSLTLYPHRKITSFRLYSKETVLNIDRYNDRYVFKDNFSAIILQT